MKKGKVLPFRKPTPAHGRMEHGLIRPARRARVGSERREKNMDELTDLQKRILIEAVRDPDHEFRIYLSRRRMGLAKVGVGALTLAQGEEARAAFDDLYARGLITRAGYEPKGKQCKLTDEGRAAGQELAREEN